MIFFLVFGIYFNFDSTFLNLKMLIYSSSRLRFLFNFPCNLQLSDFKINLLIKKWIKLHDMKMYYCIIITILVYHYLIHYYSFYVRKEFVHLKLELKLLQKSWESHYLNLDNENKVFDLLKKIILMIILYNFVYFDCKTGHKYIYIQRNITINTRGFRRWLFLAYPLLFND